jgi:hypothetical protein
MEVDLHETVVNTLKGIGATKPSGAVTTVSLAEALQITGIDRPIEKIVEVITSWRMLVNGPMRHYAYQVAKNPDEYEWFLRVIDEKK